MIAELAPRGALAAGQHFEVEDIAIKRNRRLDVVHFNRYVITSEYSNGQWQSPILN